MTELPDRSDNGSTYSIRAVERVCDLLDLVQRTQAGFTLADVVAATDLPKSSAFRYLATLEERHYVERDPVTGQFRIGSGFLPQQTRHLDVLVERARPLLEALRDRFGETVNLAVLDGNRTSYAEIVESRKSMRLSARKGDRDPLHCTAVGKAIATLLPAERLKAILEAEGMPARTDTTITDVETFFGEVELTRDRGYAIDDRENEPDGRCVAVPLGDPHMPVALSLSAPSARFPIEEVEAVARALQDVARDLQATLAARS
ncbi:MAG: IclR family transcriptional regulator [Nitriliruptoraceae bacterium]